MRHTQAVCWEVDMAKYWRHTAQPKLGQGMRAAQPRLLNLIRNQVEHALSAQVRNKRAARERAARVAPRVLRPPRRLERRSTLVAALGASWRLPPSHRPL